MYNINLSNNCGKYLSCIVLDSIGILQLSRFHSNIIFRVLTDILSCVCFQTIAKTSSPTGGQLYAHYSCLPLLTRYANLVKILKIHKVYRIFMWGGNQWCGEGQKRVFYTGEQGAHKQRGWIPVIFAFENSRGQNSWVLGKPRRHQ